MNKIAAEKFIAALAWTEGAIGQLDSLLLELSQEEKEHYKKALGGLLFNHFEMIMPIINQYPELDPEGAGQDNYRTLRESFSSKFLE